MSGGPRGTRPPLDFKAIEARLMRKIRHRSDEVLTIGCDTARDVEALLAHARALREGLQRLHNIALRVMLVPSGATPEWLLALDEAAAVLAAAQDGPDVSAPPEGP